MIDIVVEGMEEMKSVTIISDKPDEIADSLLKTLGRGVTFLHGEGAFSKEAKKIIYVIVGRIELSGVRSVVNDIDPKAVMAIENLAEVAGSNLKKSSSAH
jgi:uncharacterized membrane-anchored protein YitT (DUF2179 family)